MKRSSRTQTAAHEPRPISAWIWLALVLATAAAYSPAWFGGMLWDDDAHVTPEPLRSWNGLVTIWLDPSATQQYYPVSSTAFWLMAQLWGSHTLGYHLVSIVLHATSAFLIVVILRRLGVAAAMVAAVMFALHPVQVESVAWISEIKNTLSGVFFLGSLLAYLRFDASRGRASYLVALGLFVLALGSKTVTATLPAAMLVILWWQRGHLDLKRDVLPIAPFFALGLLAGLFTSWFEVAYVGARGGEFALSPMARVLIAGRAAWFYVWKLVWPVGLVFNYPRWNIDSAVWWQYLFPIALLATLIALMRRSAVDRGPAAAALFFLVTLAPALGFVNVYPFRYSFVADHFQYLACLGILTALASVLLMLAQRMRPGVSPLIVAFVVAVPLGTLTFLQSREYVNAETLYRATIARNPWSSLARNNLAQLLLDGPSSGWTEGLELAVSVLSFKPDDPVARNLTGLGLQKAGRTDESIREFREAIRLRPSDWQPHYNLGLALFNTGRFEEAVHAYEACLAIYPRSVAALHNLAIALRRQGKSAEASVRLRQAVALQPDLPDARFQLADALQESGQLEDAVREYASALQQWPDHGQGWNNYGLALRRLRREADARAALENADRLIPNSPLVLMNLSASLEATGDLAGALRTLDRALAASGGPQSAALHNRAGLLSLRLGRQADAVAHFEAALRVRPDFAEARANLEKARK